MASNSSVYCPYLLDLTPDALDTYFFIWVFGQAKSWDYGKHWFLIVAGFLIFSIKNQPLNRIFYNVLLLCIAIGLIFMLEIPEERVHFLEYGVLGFFVLKATNEKVFITFVFVSLVGAVDEFIQFLLPQRVGELRDVLMNIVGGALGIWIRKLQN